jgi:hypothetical protein
VGTRCQFTETGLYDLSPDYALTLRLLPDDPNGGPEQDSESSPAVLARDPIEQSLSTPRGDRDDWFTFELRERAIVQLGLASRVALPTARIIGGEDLEQVNRATQRTWAGELDAGRYFVHLRVPKNAEDVDTLPYSLGLTLQGIEAVEDNCTSRTPTELRPRGRGAPQVTLDAERGPQRHCFEMSADEPGELKWKVDAPPSVRLLVDGVDSPLSGGRSMDERSTVAFELVLTGQGAADAELVHRFCAAGGDKLPVLAQDPLGERLLVALRGAEPGATGRVLDGRREVGRVEVMKVEADRAVLSLLDGARARDSGLVVQMDDRDCRL